MRWGIQGLFLKLLFFLTVIIESGRAAKHQVKFGNNEAATLHLGYLSGLAAFMLTSVFGDYLDAEWGYWMAAILVGYSRVYGPGGFYEAEKESIIAQETIEEDSSPVSAVVDTRRR